MNRVKKTVILRPGFYKRVEKIMEEEHLSFVALALRAFKLYLFLYEANKEKKSIAVDGEKLELFI